MDLKSFGKIVVFDASVLPSYINVIFFFLQTDISCRYPAGAAVCGKWNRLRMYFLFNR